MSRFILVLPVVVLAACYGATPYQARSDGYGYSEQKLEANRFRVTFAGNAATPRETVENYLLYRAAELTLAQGYDHFVLADQRLDEQRRYGAAFSGYDGFGYYRRYPYPVPRYGLGVSSISESSRYEAEASIVAYKGAKPDGDLKAFDARDLMANLQPRIVQPQMEAPATGGQGGDQRMVQPQTNKER